MHSLASAAKLLDGCENAPAAGPILESLGFQSGLIPLVGEHLERLGLQTTIEAPHLARGNGGLRGLVFEVRGRGELRSELNRLAHRLGANAPQLLWLILAVNPHDSEIAIATVDASRSRPRVAALVTRRGHIVDSDSETLCALAAAHTDSDVFTHCRWLEILGRESVSRRFFRALEQMVARLAASLQPPMSKADSLELALLYVSRLLFLSFLETKGWLDRDQGFLGNRYADCMVAGGKYHQRVLAPLFFGTLNTNPRNRATRARAFGRVPFLNGGLFARSHLERTACGSFFSDEALGDLFGELLARYRFTAREDSTTWSEAAIDPEMLGKAFESLMAASDRKKSGAFYTPQSLVAQVTSSALTHCLASPSLRSIDDLKVLDPACGSGAFLVHVLEELSQLRLRLGDIRPLHQIRRKILTTSIFGVDVNPTAVWLSELRLWLSMAIEDPETDPMRVTPLPNLDRNIRVGNSLSGDDLSGGTHAFAGRNIARLRARYSRATGPRKRSLSRALDTAERECAIAVTSARVARIREERRDILGMARSRDLFGERPHPGVEVKHRLSALRVALREGTRESRRLTSGGALPFSFASGFADVAASGGFDVVIGNPPWVRTHNLDISSRAALRTAFDVYRNAAWRGGSDAAAAGVGFSSQVDVAALFIERSVKLLRCGGTAALIVPAKLWRSLAGGGVRDFLMRRTALRELHDLGSADRTFDAAVYPSVVVARRLVHARLDGTSESAPSDSVSVVVHRDGQPRAWTASADRLALDESAGSPWILIPEETRRAFDLIAASGVPLAKSVTGRPLLGVKTGCNDAFLVSESGSADHGDGLVHISNSEREGAIEREMLRPVIRGERVTAWRIHPDDSRIVWTHDDRRHVLKTLPPAALRWLGHWRRDLEARTDGRGKRQWWSVFRVESADCSVPRVVWSDIAKSPRAAVIPAGDSSIPLNTCYAVRCPSSDDAFALAAIINSDIAAAWLDVVAEPARGGYRRYMGWTMAMFPLPRDWQRARCLLAPIGERAIRGTPPDPVTLRAAVLDAYHLRASAVAPLIEWRR